MNSVEVAVTHQIRIGREQAWIKVGVIEDHNPDKDNYTIEDHIDEVTRVVNRKVIDSIEQTVKTVEDYETRSK